MDREFIRAVANMTILPKRLYAFCKEPERTVLDTNDPFGKYYDVSVILRAIREVTEGGIDAKYFASWSMAYCWLLHAAPFRRDAFSDYVKETVIDILDALSFYDSLREETGSLTKFADAFVALDEMLRTDFGEVFFTETTEEEDAFVCGEDGSRQAELLAVARDGKTYALLWTDWLDKSVSFTELTREAFNEKKKELQEKGFRALSYSFTEE